MTRPVKDSFVKKAKDSHAFPGISAIRRGIAQVDDLAGNRSARKLPRSPCPPRCLRACPARRARLDLGAIPEPQVIDQTPRAALKLDIAVIGAGQAGLSSAYH